MGLLRGEQWHISHPLKHGQSGGHRGTRPTPTYICWMQLQQRCKNPKHNAFKNYGGRGISVCERWQGEGGFLNFFDDMGERPEGTSIDRIDNDGNYEPGNCRWATPKEQKANQRCNGNCACGGKQIPTSHSIGTNNCDSPGCTMKHPNRYLHWGGYVTGHAPA